MRFSFNTFSEDIEKILSEYLFKANDEDGEAKKNAMFATIDLKWVFFKAAKPL